MAKIIQILILVLILRFGSCIDLETIQALMTDFHSTVEKPVSRLANLFRANFAPTLWCGIRHAAPLPDALSAVYPHLDFCCRNHDQCPLIIPRGTRSIHILFSKFEN